MLRSALILAVIFAALTGWGILWAGAAAFPLVPIFAAFTTLAVWSTWVDDDLRWVGVWLLVSYGAANWMHAEMHVSGLPGPYAMIEVMILLATAVAWDSHRRYWGLVVLGGLNILSICVCIAFAAEKPIVPRHIFVFELTTNICFAAECLLAIGAGIADGYRTGRFNRLPFGGRRTVATNVARIPEIFE